MRPVVGIITCNRQVGEESALAVMGRYADAAMRFGDADALLVPAVAEHVDAANIVRRLDGVLLTGSPSNVAPHRYGASAGDGPFDDGRDSVALALIDAALAQDKPVFGICRGFQEINVALGGTLRGDVGAAAPLAHHADDGTGFDAMFAHRHPVVLTPGGVLARATGRSRLEVNSVHYQGIDRLAAGLAVEARADDGLIEAVSGAADGTVLLAVQWHPEWRTGSDGASQSFFQLLGRALRGVPLTEPST